MNQSIASRSPKNYWAIMGFLLAPLSAVCFAINFSFVFGPVIDNFIINLGIVSLVSGLVASIIGLTRKGNHGFALSGLILSIIIVLMPILFIAIFVAGSGSD